MTLENTTTLAEAHSCWCVYTCAHVSAPLPVSNGVAALSSEISHFTYSTTSGSSKQTGNMISLWLAPIALIAALLSHYVLLRPRKLDIPRVGPKPGLLGNTSKGYFYKHSKELLAEGYSKYKYGLYSLWTTDMDRVVLSAKFMKDFMPLPRSQVQLTASIRHGGRYTGMNIAEKGSLAYDVCTIQLSQNIGRLAQPVYDEVLHALKEKLRATQADEAGYYSIPAFFSLIELVTSGTARVFVGPELCRNPEWLSTATGYTMDVAKVTEDLRTYPRVFYPIVAPFLKSFHQIRSRFALAKQLLVPIFAARNQSTSREHPDMAQWLVESAKGRDLETDRLVMRMLFLNMAAIHTSAETATNVLLELCARPEYISMLREEMVQAVEDHNGISLATLSSLKKTDSFIKEAHRMNTLGFLTFNRHLAKPVKLSNGVTLPASTYISMCHAEMQFDPEYFPNPYEFNGLRFYNLRQNDGDGDKHQFASVNSTLPWWGVGKFACPGRFWASAQIKLILMVLLLNFEVRFPIGQTEAPPHTVADERNQVSFTQLVLLKPRGSFKLDQN